MGSPPAVSPANRRDEVRDIVVSTYVTLDGVFEEPRWSADYWSDEAQLFARDILWASDALLLGRETYEGFAAAWPTEEHIKAEGEFAARMNSMPKYVASKSLKEPLEWENSHLLGDDVPGAVSELKKQGDKDLLVYSSATLMRSLMEEGLIDRHKIWLHPLVLGSGRRLFPDGPRAELELTDSATLPNGIVVLDYRQVA
jgi:dihydrofolate reductase